MVYLFVTDVFLTKVMVDFMEFKYKCKSCGRHISGATNKSRFGLCVSCDVKRLKELRRYPVEVRFFD